MADERWSVRVAPDLREHLRAIKTKADAQPSSATATVYRALRRVFDELLTQPSVVMAKEFALEKPLTNVRSIGFGSRSRALFIASPEHRTVVVLFIGDRKDGDRSDVYAQFTMMLRKGAYDAVFEELGVEKPSV